MIRNPRRGAATIEMTLVGIPIIFVLISTFEMSRGMWMYHTLAYSVKNGVPYSVKHGVRFASVHGLNCVFTPEVPNDCATSIAAIAAVIQNAAVGIDPAKTELTFKLGPTGGISTPCYMGTPGASPPYGTLPACSTLTTTWPTNDGTGVYNGVGKRIEIDIETPFASALSMFWPGSKPVSFALVNFGASSADLIQF